MQIKKIFSTSLILVAVLVLGVFPLASYNRVNAENILCDVFPFLNDMTGFGIDGLCGKGTADNAASGIAQWVEFGLSLIFIGIIGISVFVIIKGAIKYIRSEGDADKVVEAQKAIKSVFVGVGALFVGLIGVVVIVVVFGATGALEDDSGVPDQLSPFINQGGSGGRDIEGSQSE